MKTAFMVCPNYNDRYEKEKKSPKQILLFVPFVGSLLVIEPGGRSIEVHISLTTVDSCDRAG
jgi:hypothetical protein